MTPRAIQNSSSPSKNRLVMLKSPRNTDPPMAKPIPIKTRPAMIFPTISNLRSKTTTSDNATVRGLSDDYRHRKSIGALRESVWVILPV